MPIQGERFFADAGLGSVSATVATLPVGCTMGEERVHEGITYRLCYNAGTAAIAQAKVASPVCLANCGIGSVAVSTLSNHGDHIGVVIARNTSVSAGLYFWGAARGEVGAAIMEDASAPTGTLVSVGNAGVLQIASVASSRLAIGFVKTTVSNGGTATGNVIFF